LQEVKWAGNPYEKFVKEGTEGYLEPRKSFKTWTETIVGRCRDWTDEEIETASVLCLVYGKFIDVWRQKEAALQNSQLTKLLLANSAHEVRTPLNAIINYLEIALEGHLDQDTRDNLSRSHSASKSLVYVINGRSPFSHQPMLGRPESCLWKDVPSPSPSHTISSPQSSRSRY
jgi:light-regulated signal transduction histidine kinase (bacteriophytochrome)